MMDNDHNRSTHKDKMFHEREENAWAHVKMTFEIQNSFQYKQGAIFT